MSPMPTILVTAGSESANHGSFDTMGVSQPIAFTPTWCATTVEEIDFDNDASWNTVSGSTLSRVVTSLTPKPLLYTVFPPCTTATANPGTPDFFIRSSAMPSSLATALSTALSGSGIAGTSGGGMSDSVGFACSADGFDPCCAGPEPHAASIDIAAAIAISRTHEVLALITASTLAGYRCHHGSNADERSGKGRDAGAP